MNLNTSIDLDLKRFFQWWARELAFLVPEKLRQLLSDQTGILVFTAEADCFAVDYEAGAAEPLRVRLPFTDQGLEAWQQFSLQRPILDKAERVLRLTAHHALHKIVYLPIAAEENLAQVIGFELDRYTPFKAEQVYFAAKLLEKTDSGQLKILLVFSPKPKLESALAQLQSLGVQPAWIDYDQAANDYVHDPKPYNLLPVGQKQRSNKMGQWLHGLLSFVLLSLLVGTLLLPVWLESLVVDDLRDQLKSLEKDTRLVEAQQREMDAMLEETKHLFDIKNKTPSTVAMLNELSRLMKDDTWLNHLQYNVGQLQIQGQSPTASALIGVLEESEHFSQASFASPLTQDKTTGLERFQISVTVEAVPPETEEVESEEEPAAADEEPVTDETTTEVGNE